MPDAAIGARAGRRSWAVPGSSHDRIVRFAKVALPSAVGVLVALLALAPLDRKSEISFILDKNKVDNAPERMRVERARYVGSDDRGQRFEVTAGSALQRSSEVPVVDINAMVARLALAQGPVIVSADQGRYDLDTQRVDINGPVRVDGPDGYKLTTSDVLVDLKQRQVRSDKAVQGQMRLGTFTAGRMRADLGTRTIVLDGGTRLKIVQGGVR